VCGGQSVEKRCFSTVLLAKNVAAGQPVAQKTLGQRSIDRLPSKTAGVLMLKNGERLNLPAQTGLRNQGES